MAYIPTRIGFNHTEYKLLIYKSDNTAISFMQTEIRYYDIHYTY